MAFSKSTLVCSLASLLAWIPLVPSTVAQESTRVSENRQIAVQVPRLIPYAATATDPQGKLITAAAEITFALYKEQDGGPQLWTEVQHIQPDANGRYSIMLGVNSPNGIPQGIFNSTEARWLGISVNGGVELPRTMLLAVPYALKAGDAQTLGGLPASAFMRDSVRSGAIARSSTAASAPEVDATVSAAARTSGAGTADYVPLWSGATTLGNSIMHQSGSTIAIGSTVLEGDGASPVNVKAFGATGNGITDDTAAINAAIAALPATGGSLYFPAGNYYTSSCGFTLAVPFLAYGAGQTSRDDSQTGSQITCGSSTANLFTVTAKVGTFRDLGFWNSASAPTAGAAVFTNGAMALQRISYDNISVTGFYDGIHVGVGSSWILRSSHFKNNVRYALNINNTVQPDDGDWVVTDNYFEGGPRTSTTTSAAIAIFSSGGGKIANNKSNATFVNGIYMFASGSVQTLINHNDIENTLGPPIYIAQGWPGISIIGNYLSGPPGQPDMQLNSMTDFIVADNNLYSYGAAGALPAAMIFSNVSSGIIGINRVFQHFAAATQITNADGVTDLSPLMVTASTGDNISIGCVATGCPNSSTLTFSDNYAGNAVTASIESSYAGNGITFTAPRDFVGKGYFFNSKSGATRFFIDTGNGAVKTGNTTLDDGTGNMNIPAGKSYQVGGVSILPLSAVTPSLGGAALTTGQCSSAVLSVPGAATSMVVETSPIAYPGDQFVWRGYVSAAGTVTVKVCALAAGTPTASVYNIRVIP